MTLEDFFTLTEMKNGFVSLARVEELVSIMQQQKDFVISNISDTARQWSTVASTLTATENKDCLDHFIKLNGLFYLNQWLQGALKCSSDGADFAVEELLNSLLGSLERLTVYTEDLVASGIQLTVEQFVGFKSLDIKEKAKTLSERWKHATKNGISQQDIDKEEKCVDDNVKIPNDVVADDVNSAYPVLQNSTCTEESKENVAGCVEASQLDKAEDMQTSTENEIVAAADSNLENKNVLPSALVLNPCEEKVTGREDSSQCPASDIASSAKCSRGAPGDVADDHCDASKLKDDSVKDTKMEADAEGDITSNPGLTDSCYLPSSSGLSVSSHAHKPGRSISCNFDVKDFKSCTSDTLEALPRSASIDCVVPKYLRKMDSKPDIKDLLSNGYKLRMNTDPETSLSEKEEVGSTREGKMFGSVSKQNFSRIETVASHDFSKPAEKKATNNMDENSDLGLEYGEIDALEVARQVAIEVEREVVDYREPFCSSSPDDNLEGDTSPQCSDDQKGQPVNEKQNGIGSSPHEDLDDASSTKDDNNLTTAGTNTDPGKCEQDVEMAEPITQNRCTFDLNEDVCVEESDCVSNHTVNINAPIVVSASKGAPVLPVSPLRFEGELGWKGSAATSAFRPASPRKTPDTDKTSSGHKRKANLIEFDLNVADSGDDDQIDHVSVKPKPISSSIHSRDDSAEVSSRRVDKFKLDLNSLGEEDTSPFPSSSHWSLPTQNGDRTMSPASSSTRDFDLNDNPGYFDAMGSHNPSRFPVKASGMHANSKPDNVITIMGSKISERKDYLDGASLSFMANGPSIDANAMTSRPVMPYAQIPHPVYGYNGSVIGPPMPYPPPFYAPGSIPYMVDSRGATVVPQILSTPVLNAPSSSMPPFLMNVSSTNPGLNVAGTSQSGLDLNSGFLSLDTGIRESGNFKNFFVPQGQNGSTASQPTSWR
ncbi:uncharacterized protein A4U43_C10F1950 [Asparagus officinalis]|uniref:TFIIS N-terminal domain-containing protein n=1 Tax=Asparagus officinalis TaxID=4686 RepID=A0A5P1DZZ3_ASPOF|nr:uncharacterized protein LOC109825050 [Asparagus officinalis]XP_020247337.1 uncharacterized protein LOC109825050 [Asparagus officinalis]XP_020247338.1 uncharacterized protein LOC109825050 [Asparagus officinalis]ONK55884.1 uncharacterized protein A4U43_C10F1950 [Asparagus officinalis]